MDKLWLVLLGLMVATIFLSKKESFDDELSVFSKTYNRFVNRHVPSRNHWDRVLRRRPNPLTMMSIHGGDTARYRMVRLL